MPYRVDPSLAGRHPFELFTIFLAFLSALPTVFGIIPQPGSIREVMPAWMSWGWAVILLAGASIALIGIYNKARIPGLILEQFGLALLAVASAAYSVCVVFVVGQPAIFTGAIILGFAISCVRRYFHIQGTLNTLRAEHKAIVAANGDYS